MRPRTPRLPFLAVALTATALLGARTAAAQPDLFAQSINGAGTVTPGEDAWINLYVLNVGDPFVGTYDIEIVLSEDVLVDALDPVVATFTTGSFGVLQYFVQLPPAFPEGTYHWGMRLVAAPGETELSNNQVIGSFTAVYHVDLALDTAGPLEVFAEAGGGPVELFVKVANQGTANGILIFRAAPLDETPWLTIDPPESFVVGGQPANEIRLLLDPSDLPASQVQTTIRFENVYDATDFAELVVELNVTPAVFVPGDLLTGYIETVDEINEFSFFAVEGMRFITRGKSTSPATLRLELTVVDPDGVIVKTTVQDHDDRDKTKRTFKLEKNGLYVLRVAGDDDTKGGYKIKTGRRMPPRAKPRNVVLKNPLNGEPAVADVLLLPDGVLDFELKPNALFAGPLIPAVREPQGDLMPLGPMSPVEPRGIKVVDMEVHEAGPFDVEADGFGGNAKEKVKARLVPIQPPKGNAVVNVP